MTVKQLIKKLKVLDQDLPVKVMVDDTKYTEFDDGDTYKETNYMFSNSDLSVIVEITEEGKFVSIYGDLDKVLTV